MARRKLPNPKDTADPVFWRQWFRTERHEGNSVVFGWLKDTMTQEELAAIKQASEIEGYDVIETKKGGEVRCKTCC
jgi:hypothetical protein